MKREKRGHFFLAYMGGTPGRPRKKHRSTQKS